MAIINGTSGNDNNLTGGAGNDVISGFGGFDTLTGGAGNDQLFGGTDGDFMHGNTGNDEYHVDSYSDFVTEHFNQGFDTVFSTRHDYFLGDNIEKLVLQGSAITGVGNILNNTIIGNNSNNTINGGGGQDILYGMGGNDRLVGGSGEDEANNDILIGGSGRDSMIGFGGADTFVFNSVSDSPANSNPSALDEIELFRGWEGDKIDVSAIDGNLNLPGNQPFTAGGYNDVTGVLTGDVIGSAADFQIMLLGAPALNLSVDIIL